VSYGPIRLDLAAAMIVRDRVSDNFTIIPNSILNDRRLSVEAQGVLCYLASKPDHWKVRAAEIESRFGMRTKKRRRIMRELADAGYLSITTGGPSGGYDVTVFINSSDCAQKRQSLKGIVAKGPTLVRTETAAKTETPSKSILSSPTREKSYPQGKYYGRKLSAVEQAAAATARGEARIAADERAGCLDEKFEWDWL